MPCNDSGQPDYLSEQSSLGTKKALVKSTAYTSQTGWIPRLIRIFTVNSEIFAWVLLLRSFVKIIPLQNGKISLMITDVDKSCPSCEFLTWQICLLTVFAKIKFSQ